MTKNWRLWAILLIFAAIGGDFLFFRSGLFGQGRQVVINGIAAPPLPTLDAIQVAEGQALYARHCASCHGVHNILKSSDPKATTHAKNLGATCGSCHPGAGQRFAIGQVHVVEGANEPAALRWVRQFYVDSDGPAEPPATPSA